MLLASISRWGPLGQSRSSARLVCSQRLEGVPPDFCADLEKKTKFRPMTSFEETFDVTGLKRARTCNMSLHLCAQIAEHEWSTRLRRHGR